MILLELLRNGYGASNGVPNSAAIFAALYTLKWNDALAKGQAAADALDQPTGDMYAFVLQSTFANEMGWTWAEMQTFLADGRFDLTPEDGINFERAYDAYDDMVEHRKRHGSK